MPQDNSQKQKTFRERHDVAGNKEIRGVYAPVKHHKELKDDLRTKVKKILEGN